jgi:hypothetical protein
MLKDLSNNTNKDLLAANKIRVGIVFENKQIEKIL